MLSSVPGIENLSPAIKYVIAFAIIFALLALFALVLRRLTGSKLTLANAGGRARQPRLGIVDVYDLDRQRQLILLRRDNVEHLLLVGGPNDVVVETNIVRGPGGRAMQSAAEIVDRPDGGSERLPELPPAAAARPVIEGPPPRPSARGSEPVGAGQPGRTDNGSAGAGGQVPRGSASARQAELPARPVGGATPGGGPARPAAAPPTRPAPARQPPPRPAAAPPREADAGARVGLSDMARQLEDALRRPSEPQGNPARPAEPPKASPPPRAPTAEPAQTPPPEQDTGRNPREPQGQPVRGQRPPNRVAPPAPPDVPPSRQEDRIPSPPVVVPEPPPPPPAVAAPPERVQAPEPMPEPPTPPEPPPAPEPASPPPPTPRPDPFSIEDIEAEFARLLGRPLDRKDKS